MNEGYREQYRGEEPEGFQPHEDANFCYQCGC
jgi:hypothetical protein